MSEMSTDPRPNETCCDDWVPHARIGEQLLDPRKLLAGCGGNEMLLQMMTQSFQTYAPERLADLGNAAERNDVTMLQRAAHKLRGLASTFSTIVAEEIRMLEQSAGDRQVEAARHQYRIVAELIPSLSAALSNLSIDDLERLAIR
jgi:HPt (histidine-containing phosphotransfer) domain-containing protein